MRSFDVDFARWNEWIKDCCFLKAVDTGKEVYFHHNSVTNKDFSELQIGYGVRFKETLGKMGPQATTVHVLDAQSSVSSDEPVPDAAKKPLGWGS